MLSLKNIIRANGISCISFGGLFIVNANTVAHFLANKNPVPEQILIVIGTILVFNGVHLIWTSMQLNINKWLILYFSLGDALWLVVSMGLAASSFWINTTQGITATSLVAIMVGIFGLAQWRLSK